MDAATVGTAPLAAERQVKLALPFVLVTLIWSSTWLVVRGQLGVVPPAWSVTYRFVVAAAAMLAYARMSGASLRLSARQHGFAAAYGVAQYALNYYGVYLAERSVTSGLVAVVFALLVVPNAILARLFLAQGVSRRFVAGSAIALGGIALLFAHELHAAPSAHRLVVGIAWSLFAVLVASIAQVAQGSAPARAIPMASFVAWGMAWGAAFDACVAFALDGPPVFHASPAYWAGTLYLALIGSALAFTLYARLIHAVGPGRAAYTSVLTPAIAMILSTLFEGYRWSWEAALGCAAALAGLVVALRARQSASPAR
jgi:drug/metabolite transporter (DMT)-like permease